MVISPVPGGVGSSKPAAVTSDPASNSSNNTLNSSLPIQLFNEFPAVSTTSQMSNVQAIDSNDPKNIHAEINQLTKKIAGDPNNITHLVNRGFQFLNLRSLDKNNVEVLKSAKSDFDAVLKIDKLNSKAFYGSGLVHLQCEEYVHAKAKIGLALRAAPKDIEMNKALGKACSQLGKYQEAISCCEIIYEQLPKDVSNLTDLGELYIHAGRYFDSIKKISEAYNYTKEDSPEEKRLFEISDRAFLKSEELYDTLMLKEMYAQAVDLFRYTKADAKVLQPEDYERSKGLAAEGFLRRNWPETAKCTLEGGLVEEEDEEVSINENVVVDLDNVDLLGHCYYLSRDYKAARDAYSERLKSKDARLSGGEKESFLMKAAFHSYKFAKNADEEYLRFKRQLKKEFPESPCLKFLEGFENYSKKGKNDKERMKFFEAANNCFQAYLNMKPDCPYGNYYIAKNLLKEKFPIKALEYLDYSLSNDAFDYRTLALRGKIREEVGVSDLKGALEDYRTCAKHLILEDPFDADNFVVRKVIGRLAYLEHLAGDRAKAERLFELVVRIDEENNVITKPSIFLFGKFLYDIGKFTEALDLFKQLRNPDSTYQDDNDIWIVKCRIGIGKLEDLLIAATICNEYINNPEYLLLLLKAKEKINAFTQKLTPVAPPPTPQPVKAKKARPSRIRKEKLEAPKETEEQKAERLKKEAEFEAVRKENLRKLDEDRIKKEAEDRQKLETHRSLEKLAAQEEAERVKQDRFLKAKSSRREVVSGNSRIGKAERNPQYDFQKQKKIWLAEEAKAIAQSKAVESPAPRSSSPTRLAPPPIVQIVNKQLYPPKEVPRAFAPDVLQPIASINILSEVVIPLKSDHIERIRGAIEALEAVQTLINTQSTGPKGILERLIFIKLEEFLRIISSAQSDTEFKFFFNRIISENNLRTMQECMNSPSLIYSNFIDFAKMLVGSSCITRLLEFKHEKNWPIKGTEKSEKIEYATKKFDDEIMLSFINIEIHVLHYLAEKSKLFNLTDNEKSVFKQCLRNILLCSSAIKEEYLRDLNKNQLNVEEIRKFLQQDQFLSGWAVNLTEGLLEYTTSSKAESVDVRFAYDD